MNKKTHIRRKWAFEKGRNSSSVFLAVLTVAAVAAAIGVLFDYEYDFRESKEQNTVITMIDPVLNTELFEIISRRDPAYTYGTLGGSFSTLLGEHKYELDTSGITLPPIPEYPAAIPAVEMKDSVFPASIRYAVIPPAPKKTPVTQVIMPDGRIVTLPRLSELKGKAQRPGMIRITGSGFLLRSELLRSCGDGELDKKAQNILKSAGMKPGIYLINWAAAGEKI